MRDEGVGSKTIDIFYLCKKNHSFTAAHSKRLRRNEYGNEN